MHVAVLQICSFSSTSVYWYVGIVKIMEVFKKRAKWQQML